MGDDLMLSPKERATLLRRGYRAGYHAALRKCRAELHAMDANFKAERASLQHEFNEIGKLAAVVHRVNVAHAIKRAVNERAGIPDASLN
jgi:hypothetical protein